MENLKKNRKVEHLEAIRLDFSFLMAVAASRNWKGYVHAYYLFGIFISSEEPDKNIAIEYQTDAPFYEINFFVNYLKDL